LKSVLRNTVLRDSQESVSVAFGRWEGLITGQRCAPPPPSNTHTEAEIESLKAEYSKVVEEQQLQIKNLLAAQETAGGSKPTVAETEALLLREELEETQAMTLQPEEPMTVTSTLTLTQGMMMQLEESKEEAEAAAKAEITRLQKLLQESKSAQGKAEDELVEAEDEVIELRAALEDMEGGGSKKEEGELEALRIELKWLRADKDKYKSLAKKEVAEKEELRLELENTQVNCRGTLESELNCNPNLNPDGGHDDGGR